MKNYISILLFGALLMAPINDVRGQNKTAPELRFSKHPIVQRVAGKAVHSTAAVYRPTESLNLFWEEADWVNQSRTRREYEAGVLKHEFEDIWDAVNAGAWQSSGRTDYAYENGNVSQITTNWSNGDDVWTPQARTSYTYQNGRETSMLSEVWTGLDWMPDERAFWNYSNDIIAGGLTEIWDGSSWVPSDQFVVAEDGGQTVETWQEWTGNAWTNADRYTYPGMTIADLYEFIETFQGEISDYAGMYYSFRLPDYVDEIWDSGSWVSVARQSTVRERDAQTGDLLRETMTSEEYNGTEWYALSRLDIEYTNPVAWPGLEGLPAVSRLQFLDGEDWVDVFVETYILQNVVRRIAQATLAGNFGEGLTNISQIRIIWTNVSVGTEAIDGISSITLRQNYPNPVNTTTRISYNLSESSNVRLSVFDLLGRAVAVLEDGFQSAGDHIVDFEPTNLSAGFYAYRLESGGASLTRQLLVVR